MKKRAIPLAVHAFWQAARCGVVHSALTGFNLVSLLKVELHWCLSTYFNYDNNHTQICQKLTIEQISTWTMKCKIQIMK